MPDLWCARKWGVLELDPWGPTIGARSSCRKLLMAGTTLTPEFFVRPRLVTGLAEGCTRCAWTGLAWIEGWTRWFGAGRICWDDTTDLAPAGAPLMEGSTLSPRGFFFFPGRYTPCGIFRPKDDDGITISPTSPDFYRSRPCSSFLATRNSNHDTAQAIRPSSTMAFHQIGHTALAGEKASTEAAIAIQNARHAVQ